MKVSLVVAMTLDGKIGRSVTHFPDWTGNEDKKNFVKITKKAGLMVMGSRTFDVIGNVLPRRKILVMTKKKKRELRSKDAFFVNMSAEKIVGNLKNLGQKQIMICGGLQINQIFLSKKLIDELIITFSPMLFGEGVSFLLKRVELKFKLSLFKLIDKDSICAIYKIVKN